MMENSFKENRAYGWILLFRSIQNHWIFQDDKYFKWWVIILLEVNHNEEKFLRGKEVYLIKRGQSCNSLDTWARLFKCRSAQTVSNFFKTLEKEEMISVRIIGNGRNKLTLVSVVNYNIYQTQNGNKIDTNQTQNGNKSTTNKEGKEFKKEDIYSNNLKFDFVEEPFKESFMNWVNYRHNLNKPYRTQKRIENVYKKLKEMSNNSPLEANGIIQFSIAQEYDQFYKRPGLHLAKHYQQNIKASKPIGFGQ